MDAQPASQSGAWKAAAVRRVARLGLRLLAFLAPFAFILAFDAALLPNSLPGLPRLAEAEILRSAAAGPADLPAAGWQHVRLGHALIGDDARDPVSGWFRLSFDAGAAPRELWSVYLPRPYATAAAFVNGEYIGDSGMNRPFPVHREPLRFTFPARILHAGQNQLLLHVVASIDNVGLNRIYVGPAASIERAYRFTTAVMDTSRQVIVIMLYVASLTMLTVFLMRPRDSAFGWFALALMLWATHHQMYLMSQALLESRVTWENIADFSLGAYAICAAMFTHSFLGLRRERTNRALLAWGAIGAAVLVVYPLAFGGDPSDWCDYVWIPATVAIGAYQLGVFAWAYWRRPCSETAMLLAASWFMNVVGARDALVDFGVLPANYTYLAFTSVPVFIVFGALLLRRFVRALDTSERANEALERRVAEKSRELERNLGRLKDLERERALSTERERIMQDMHDGIGGHLVQALSIAAARTELAPVEESLRTCLDELRLMIDSIEPVEGDLASVLGTLRMRMSRRLAQAGIELSWQIGDLPPLPELGPKHVLEITRVVQEAITNALKHSGASRIRVAAGAIDGPAGTVIRVEVCDEGQGFLPGERGEGTGRGLANMRRRAATLGAQLDVETSTRGTVVRLDLPIASSPATGGQAREQGLPVAPARPYTDPGE
jgi:signal transduction histidine kinase